MTYKGLLRLVLDYASPVWDPSGKTHQDELVTVPNRAKRFLTRSLDIETGSVIRILEQLK